MKRSEMLARLEEEFSTYETAENIARRALSICEEAGMLPPGYLKPISFENGKQYPLIPGDFLNVQGIWCTPGVNEWELEDDVVELLNRMGASNE